MRRKGLSLLGILLALLVACGPVATAMPPPATSSLQATPTASAVPTTPTPLTPTGTPKPTPATQPTPPAEAGKPKYGGTVRYAERSDPPSWDPSTTNATPTSITKSLAFSKLFDLWSDKPQNCQSDAYPIAVEKWRWVDDITAEFTLKQGLRFQNRPPVNGREAVAQDFVAAFARYKQNFAYMAAQSAMIDSVTATDKYTFRMKLKSSWGGFMSELLVAYRGPWLEAPEAGGPEGKLWQQPEKSWIGTGPFMFDFWRPGVKWRMVRNPDFWIKGQPYLDAVEFVVIPESSTQLAALRSGQLNLARDFSELLIDTAQEHIPGLQVVRCPGAVLVGAGWLFINNSGPPFNDVRVRRAVAMAIDQQRIVKNLYSGRARVASLTLSPAIQYAMKVEGLPSDVLPFVEYHPDRAKQLLAEAGYANGFDTTIHFTSRYAAPAVMVAEALVAMLGEVGIRTKLDLIDYVRYVNTVQLGNYPVGNMNMGPRNSSSPENPLALTTFYSKGGKNLSKVNDPEYDRLFEQFQAASDESKRGELARQLQIMAASKAYAVPLPLPDSTMTALSGLHFTWIGNTADYSMLLQTAWMD